MPALNVEFSDRELEDLRQIAKERGTSMKALVREAAAADIARHRALQEGAEAFRRFFSAHADEFAAENGVTVKVQISTDTRAQFKDATKVGKGPDVIVGAHDWLGELVQNSTVAPVNLSADVAAKFLPKAIAAIAAAV